MKKELVHSSILTVIILLINISLRTQLSFSDARWIQILELHQDAIPFNLRPLTSFIVYLLSTNFPISIATAFIIQQYSLLFILFVSFGYYLKGLGFTRKDTIIGLWFLGFSYPILCLHFIPNFTWDDLWLYISLVWVIYFFIKEKYLISAVFLTFGALSRESIFIVLPFLYIFRNKHKNKCSQVALCIAPIALYLIFRLLIAPEIVPGRFGQLFVNFATLDIAKQSLYSLIVSFGYLWILFIVSAKESVKIVNKFDERFVLGSIVVIMLCVFLTFTTTTARETRLFFIPFVFLIPIALSGLDRMMDKYRILVRKYSKPRVVIVEIVLFMLLILFSVLLFPRFEYLPMIDFHRVLFALHLLVIVNILVLRIIPKALL